MRKFFQFFICFIIAAPVLGIIIVGGYASTLDKNDFDIKESEINSYALLIDRLNSGDGVYSLSVDGGKVFLKIKVDELEYQQQLHNLEIEDNYLVFNYTKSKEVCDSLNDEYENIYCEYPKEGSIEYKIRSKEQINIIY